MDSVARNCDPVPAPPHGTRTEGVLELHLLSLNSGKSDGRFLKDSPKFRAGGHKRVQNLIVCVATLFAAGEVEMFPTIWAEVWVDLLLQD